MGFRHETLLEDGLVLEFLTPGYSEWMQLIQIIRPFYIGLLQRVTTLADVSPKKHC